MSLRSGAEPPSRRIHPPLPLPPPFSSTTTPPGQEVSSHDRIANPHRSPIPKLALPVSNTPVQRLAGKTANEPRAGPCRTAASKKKSYTGNSHSSAPKHHLRRSRALAFVSPRFPPKHTCARRSCLWRDDRAPPNNIAALAAAGS